MDLDNLVVLQTIVGSPIASHLMATKLKGVRYEGLVIDIEKGTWSFRQHKNRGIGREGITDLSSNIIGVYDPTNEEHTDRMVRDVTMHEIAKTIKVY